MNDSTPPPTNQQPSQDEDKNYRADVPQDVNVSEEDLPDKQQDNIHRSKIGRLISGWWHNKKARYGTFITIFTILVTSVLVPVSRYFLLNLFGVRSSLSITVIDKGSNQAIRDASVSVFGVTAKTDDNGNATLYKIKHGATKIIIEKRAYAKQEIPVTIGWGSNQQGKIFLQPTGVQYTFIVKDWLSGNPLEKVEAIAGQANAFSDKDGKILLTIEQSDYETSKSATIKKDQYREEKINLEEPDKSKDVALVAARKHFSVSKRSGKYDVMSGYIDGKDEKILLAGTGYEREDLALIEHPDKNIAIYISTRENKRTAAGQLMSSLMVVDETADSAKLTSTLGQSERYQPVGWMKDNFIYAFLNNGTSFESPERFKLMSYDYQTGQSKQIAAANYFNDIVIFGDRLLFTPGFSGDNKPIDKIGLFSVDSKGGDQKRLLDIEAWNILRTSYQTVSLTTGPNWFEYKMGANQVTNSPGAPALQRTRIYSDHPTQKKSLWIDERDGKGVLLVNDAARTKDTVLFTASGLRQPAQWLNNDVVVFRVSNSQETADYVISLSGGTARKIRDVTNANGTDYWIQQY